MRIALSERSFYAGPLYQVKINSFKGILVCTLESGLREFALTRFVISEHYCISHQLNCMKIQITFLNKSCLVGIVYIATCAPFRIKNGWCLANVLSYACRHTLAVLSSLLSSPTDFKNNLIKSESIKCNFIRQQICVVNNCSCSVQLY